MWQKEWEMRFAHKYSRGKMSINVSKEKNTFRGIDLLPSFLMLCQLFLIQTSLFTITFTTINFEVNHAQIFQTEVRAIWRKFQKDFEKSFFCFNPKNLPTKGWIKNLKQMVRPFWLEIFEQFQKNFQFRKQRRKNSK